MPRRKGPHPATAVEVATQRLPWEWHKECSERRYPQARDGLKRYSYSERLEPGAARLPPNTGAAGVFSAQTFMTRDGVDGEVRQGKAVADAARDTGVSHLVYSLVDGAERGSGVPHFESKAAVERHLRDLAIPATVLRPVFFMENFVSHSRPAREADGMVVLLALPADRPLQMVAATDIGFFAAEAFEKLDQYIGQSVALAGDELTGTQIAAAMQAATASAVRYQAQPLDEVRGFSADLAAMFEWLDGFGYQADIAVLRDRNPKLLSFSDWMTTVKGRRRAGA